MKKVKYFTILSVLPILLTIFNVMNVLAIEFHEDGVILDPDSYSSVYVYGCTVDVYGGYIERLNLNRGSTVNVYGGEQGHISLSHDCILNYYNGIVGWHPNIGNSGIHVSTGGFEKNPKANIYGGAIRRMNPNEDSTIIMNGYGFNFYTPTVPGELSGFWGDGTPFNIIVWRTKSPYITLSDINSNQTYRILPYSYEISPCCTADDIISFFKASIIDETLFGRGVPFDKSPNLSIEITDYHGHSPAYDFDLSEITARLSYDPGNCAIDPEPDDIIFTVAQKDVGKELILKSGSILKYLADHLTNSRDDALALTFWGPDGRMLDLTSWPESLLFWENPGKDPVDLDGYKIKHLKLNLEEFFVSNYSDPTYSGTRFYFRANLTIDAKSYPIKRRKRIAKKRLKRMKRFLKKAEHFIELTKTDKACDWLNRAYLHCDGAWEGYCDEYLYSSPNDLVVGEAAPILAFMINELMEDLGCEYFHE